MATKTAVATAAFSDPHLVCNNDAAQRHLKCLLNAQLPSALANLPIFSSVTRLLIAKMQNGLPGCSKIRDITASFNRGILFLPWISCSRCVQPLGAHVRLSQFFLRIIFCQSMRPQS